MTIHRPHEDTARTLVDAIRTIAGKPANLDNLESYLSMHFQIWLEKFASTPADLACELKHFAEMDI